MIIDASFVDVRPDDLSILRISNSIYFTVSLLRNLTFILVFFFFSFVYVPVKIPLLKKKRKNRAKLSIVKIKTKIINTNEKIEGKDIVIKIINYR